MGSMRIHKPASAGGTSTPRAERQASQAPAPVPRTARTGEDARADLPVHDLSRMSIGPQPGRGELPADPRRRRGASANNTGLPNRLKAGVENLSGFAMDDVRVHFNSSKPAALHALAYTQGTDIHVGPGQERHLPHEAWHVVQQKQGRVKPTLQMKGKAINDDSALEREADAMGARALAGRGEQSSEGHLRSVGHTTGLREAVTQRQPLTGEEDEGDIIKIVIISITEEDVIKTVWLAEKWTPGSPYVYFYSEKPTSANKKSRKRERIEAHLAFQKKATDSMIKAEIKAKNKQAEEADTAADKLGVPDAVIDYLLKVVQANKEKYKLEIEPDRAKIVLMLEQFSDLAGQVEVKQWKGKKGAKGKQELRAAEEEALVSLKGLLADDEYWLDTIMETMTHTGIVIEAPSPSGGGGGGGSNDDWKSTKTEKRKGALMSRIGEQPLFHIVAGGSTLHHKMSRSHLKHLFALLPDRSSKQKGVADMWKFIDMVRTLTGSSDPQEALENWSANIELGPLAGSGRKKSDDPGESFDGSYVGGTATPRTALLQEVELTLANSSGKEIDWTEIAGMLTQTQREHALMTSEAKLKEDALTDPWLEQWTDTPDGYVRDKQKAGASSSASRNNEDSNISPSKNINSTSTTITTSTTSTTSTTGTTGTAATDISPRSVKSRDKRGQPKQESEGPKKGSPTIKGEDGVSGKIVESVVSFIKEKNYQLDGNLLVVDGSNWTCYIRCVLHHFGKIDKYGAVIAAMEKLVDLSSGVVVGSAEEQHVIALISEAIGEQFYVNAVDVAHGHSALSRIQQGTCVKLILTGAHFSLLR
jgi:hypothetical protein